MKKNMANTTKEFENMINDALFTFLQTDFKDYLFETQSKIIKKVVYSYKPTEWALHKRRMDNGGLSDIRNMDFIAYANEGAVLFVNNTRPQMQGMNNANLCEAEAVEIGDEDWNMALDMGDKHGPGPRQFTQETINKISSSRNTYTVFKRYFNGNTIQIK